MLGSHGGDIYRNQIEYDFSVSLNPLGCPEEIQNAVRAASERVCQYPDPRQEELRRALAECYDSGPGNFICGNGASELFMAIANMVKPAKVLLPAPTFSGYEYALKGEAEIVRHYLREEDGFALTDRILEDITPDLDLLFICNPNNPTGQLVEEQLLTRIIEKCKSCGVLAVIDECFLELAGCGTGAARMEAGQVAVRMAAGTGGVIVVRAFTKLFAIPGVRFGYAFATADTIEALRGNLPEWNISVFGEEAALAGCRLILKDRQQTPGEDTYLARTGAEIAAERTFLSRELAELGFRVFPSDANYILFKEGPGQSTGSGEAAASALYGALLEKGILIRDCSNFTGLGPGYYRVAVRDHDANEALVTALKEICNGD